MLGLALRGAALRGFERDFVRLISVNRSTISETVEQKFLAQIVGIEEAFSDRDKADMNSALAFLLKSVRCQWLMPRMAFQLGIRPGTIKVSVCGERGSGGIRE